MTRIIGAFRFGAILLIAVAGMLVVLMVGIIPVRIRGNRLSSWVCMFLARSFNALFNVQCTCRDPQKLYRHHGFIFPNHVSYLEPILLFSVLPVRFLAAIEVKRRPIVGQLAGAVDTVFVEREKRTSRAEARNSIVNTLQDTPYPPLVLFPEGKLGPGTRLIPFRFGAFQMATENRIAYLPCAVRYERPDVAVWHGAAGESMLAALWRLAIFPGPLRAEIIPLDPVHPGPDDDPMILARVTEHAIAKELGFFDD